MQLLVALPCHVRLKNEQTTQKQKHHELCSCEPTAYKCEKSCDHRDDKVQQEEIKHDPLSTEMSCNPLLATMQNKDDVSS